MQYDAFIPFLTSSATAAAALIGLLTVASSVWYGSDKKAASLQENILAGSAYFAFANIFFVSLIALEPFINIGYGAILLAIIGIILTIRTVKHRLHTLQRLNSTRARISKTALIGSFITYLAQLVAGILVVLNMENLEMLVVLNYVTISLFAIGLTRAWELMNVKKAQ